MPLFLIERNFAERLAVSDGSIRLLEHGNAEVGVHWLFSFLSADKRKSYCLYEADSAEAILEAARRNNIPADVIIEVSEVNPAVYLQGAQPVTGSPEPKG